MIQMNKNNHRSSSQQQFKNSFEQLQAKYIRLLAEFNSFKETSISDHQKLIQQQQKINSQNEKFVKRLQKKYQSLLHEERLKLTKQKQKFQAQIQSQKQTYQQIIENKNQSIEKLSQMIQDSEKQKTQIVEQNTQNLINIVRSEQNILQTKKYSHTELMKMYQYLLQENNCLKKQLMKVQIVNDKTKRNKKGSPIILYTDHSEVESSQHATSLNYQSSAMIKREKTLSNDDKKSLLQMNTSGVSNSQIEQKPSSSVYKPKTNASQKSKISSSYQGNDQSSSIIEQKASKKKQPPKKQQISTNQPIKKTK